MHFSIAEIAAATDGAVSGADVTVDGASIDSRTLEAGQLFVPIVAERDGHEFLPAALAAGGISVVVAQPAVRGVAVDHGIHVAAGNAEKKIGSA